VVAVAVALDALVVSFASSLLVLTVLVVPVVVAVAVAVVVAAVAAEDINQYLFPIKSYPHTSLCGGFAR